MKAYILVLLSEVLAMHTIKPVLSRLKEDSQVEVRVVNDGFCAEEIRKQNIDFDLIDEPFEENIKPYLENCDLIISGKTYTQSSEIELLKQSKKMQIPYFMMIPDIGGEIAMAKLTDWKTGETLKPDRIFVADRSTHNFLINSGIEEKSIIPAGSPYFDSFYSQIEHLDYLPVENQLVYISTPFEMDHKRGILNADYIQHELIREIDLAAKELKLNLVAKRHPQLDPELFHGIKLFEGDILQLLLQAHVVVGTYSTGLIQSSIIGVPTVSYQPWENSIREEIFARRVSIAKDFNHLTELISSSLTKKKLPMKKITYNPGNSISILIDCIYRELKLTS